MVDSWMILSFIFESFMFSFNSYPPPRLNKKMEVITFSNSFIIRFITSFMTHIVFSFETFRNHFIISLKTLRTPNNCIFTSLFFFSISLEIGSKKEGRFRAEPKGRSASFPKTVKKQKSSFCVFFRILSL
ncbi:hypothetical protein M6B38_308765 [Iris pallida]|uniref:Uncharacterized protein n=2 Tax=Iris pallida TaxID=29817 RepID=A0AAX6HL35_IRIPA|nr:hypothetical protein M6B38_248175 [Iris pallida]KAJ6841045.1 hypothetical protein M6B38_308765 [Iris pallida]